MSLAVLQIIQSPGFLETVRQRAQYFAGELQALVNTTDGPLIEVRQLGLFMGLVFSDHYTCLTMLKALLSNGIFTVYANNDKRVLQFLPPLILSANEAAEIVARLRQSLADLDSLRYRVLKKTLKVIGA